MLNILKIELLIYQAGTGIKMKDKIIIVGGGGHAKIIVDIISKLNKYEIEGIVEKNQNFDNSLNEYPFYYGDEYLQYFYKKGIKNAVLGVGGFKDNKVRKKLFNHMSSIGFKIENIIDPTAIISKSIKIGTGNTIFPGVVINTGVNIADNVIIATGTTIDHDTRIDNHVLVSAGVTIGGYCHIEEGSLIALGANIVSGVRIGNNSLIAAGSTVVNNIKENSKVYGIPAKPKQI